MQENMGNYLEKKDSNRKKQRKMHVLMLVCAIVLVVGVVGALILPGITQEAELVCGKEEHVHTDACYTAATEGDGASEERQLICGQEEHTHSDDCYEEARGVEKIRDALEIGGDALTAYDADGNINQNLEVGMTADPQTAGTGQWLQANVSSTYSGANMSDNVTVKIRISELPEGITLTGFNEDGIMYLEYGSKENPNRIELFLTQEPAEDGKTYWYVTYTQPQGSTLDIPLVFNSKAGITPDGVSVSLQVDKIEGLPEGQNATYDEKALELSWTAENTWDSVDKQVNNTDGNSIAVTNHKLSGQLTYTITAEHNQTLNAPNAIGEIWTDYVEVTDTMKLPENVSLPAGARVSDDGKAIVTADGAQTIISFTNVPDGTTFTKLELSTDNEGKQVISYTLKVPNPNRKDDGTLTMEMPHLSLEMVLDAEQLVLPEDETTLSGKQIENRVTIQPHAYKDFVSIGESSDGVWTTIQTEGENSGSGNMELKKTVENQEVQAGEEVTYNITVENTGDGTYVVQNNGDSIYTVTDELPKYMYLTEEQIAALGDSVTYDKDTNTISWVPSKTDIPAGEKYTLELKVTMKDMVELNKLGLQNDTYITNTAISNKGGSSYVNVHYTKPTLSITKTSADSDGSNSLYNGEEVTYTITVKNTSDMDANYDEVVTDTLPEGLTFKSTTIGDKTLTESGEANGTTFKVDGQELSWSIGELKAGEEVTFTYVCTFNSDEMAKSNTSGTISNTATLTDGTQGSNGINVDYPITIDKEATVDGQPATGSYESGTIFDYSIKVTNDAEHPSQQTSYTVTDVMPNGLLPYPENGNGVLYQVDKTTGDKTEISWEDFVNNNENYSTTTYDYKTQIDGYEVNVYMYQKLKLDIVIGELAAGESITINYKAQMTLTDEQIEAGNSYKFTNTAYWRSVSDSYQITGGTKVGNLKLTKLFYNTVNGAQKYGYKYSDIDPELDIQYVLTGVNESGSPVVFEDGSTELVLSLKEDYTFDGYNYYEYEIENLPVGTYTVTEKNFDVDGKYKLRKEWNCSTEDQAGYSVFAQWSGGRESKLDFDKITASTTFEIKENKTAKIENTNLYNPPTQAKIQKSVFEIARETTNDDGTVTWTSLPEKYLFATDNDDNTKTLVVYSITVAAGGGGTLDMSEGIVDKLPDGMKYLGIYSRANYEKARTSFTTGEKKTAWLDDATRIDDCIAVESVDGAVMAYKGQCLIETEYDEETNEVTFGIINGGYKTLPAGNAYSFLILCEVDHSTKAGDLLTNTVELAVPGGVELLDSRQYKTKNTPYDERQNNGKTTMTEREDGKKVISSSVSIMPQNTIVPGVEKKATKYILAGSTVTAGQDYTDDTNILSNAAVCWEIKVFNDGTEDMVNYTVDDSVTPKFHLMTKAEAEKREITTAYYYQIFNYDGTLVDEFDISDDVWANVTDATHSTYTFSFEDKKYTIPSGGYAILTMYTENQVVRNDIYTNTATVTPTQEFLGNAVEHGELVKDGSGLYTGVKASASVYALGEFASISWKTIEQKTDADNNAKGNQSKNYIAVDSTSELVTYTNNIKNVSKKVFNDFVIIDLMPMKNDTGVINRSDKRGSEFSVYYAGNLQLQVVDKDGNTRTLDESEYKIQFSDKTGFTEADFSGDETTGEWHSDYTMTDRSFRIIMGDNFTLKSNETLVISYDGQIDSAAVPGAIAWNSFGYQYYSNVDTTPIRLRAEPPKVGVMVPAIPIVQKEVVDSEDQVVERNADVTFDFTLTEVEKDGSKGKTYEFTLCQGGYCELSDLEDKDGNPIKLENGKTYILAEVTEGMPDGYEFVGIGENGSKLTDGEFEFVYNHNKDINIVVRNRVENYGYELPETGKKTGLMVVGATVVVMVTLLFGYLMSEKRRRRRSNE